MITGACRGFGRTCAEVLAEGGAELILCDIDKDCLAEVAEELGAWGHMTCDVASEASVTRFAADVLARYATLDMLINAAGGGYERTLGMYRVSRALMPALAEGRHRLLVNVPPTTSNGDSPPFPYASSRQAFQRLSAALANEARGTSIKVMMACPAQRRLAQVLPDPNSGPWVDHWDLGPPTREDALAMAWRVASLVCRDAESDRLAG